MAGPDATTSASATPPLRVGVVVPCKDEVATIERCLRALRGLQPPVERVVVVDNGSTDGSLRVARELADDVVELPGAVISALRNTGAGMLAGTDVLAFVDADTEVSDGWLAAGLAALADGADLVGSRSDAAPDAGWVAREWAHIEAALAHGGSRVWSQQLLIRTAVFEELAGFAAIPTGEDADLSIRAEAAGHEVRLVPAMTAVHHGFPDDLRGFLRRERWHTRAPGWFARMSRPSRLLVLGGAGWALLGAASAAAAPWTRRPLAAWSAATLAGVPLLGSRTSPRPVRAAQDGVLLGLWAAVRVVRLPRELASRRA